MLGALIGAGASLLGGWLGRQSQEENIQREHQRQDTSIQRRVADAKAAGVHPLYALGANVSSPSVSVGGDPMAGALHSMGQDIGRAVTAGQSSTVRADAFTETMKQLQLQNMTLRNDALASQIAKLKQPGNPPPAPGTATESPLDDKVQGRNRNIIQSTEVRGHPGYSDTEGYTDSYGEGADWIYGPLKAYMDYFYHQSGAKTVKEYRANVSDGYRRYREKPLGDNVRRGGGGYGW